jgi:hypothetical protein
MVGHVDSDSDPDLDPDPLELLGGT